MATHAHSTRTPLLRHTTGSAGLLPAGLPSRRIVAAGGPVTRAIAVMRAAEPDHPRVLSLRQKLAERIEADIALLDALDGDTDLEPSLSGLTVDWPSACGDDREHDEAERGIADDGGVQEQMARWRALGGDARNLRPCP